MGKGDKKGSGARTIELNENGAVLTIQVNARFAVKLIEYIEHLEESKKVEGDNQILAGFLDGALGRALFKSKATERFKAKQLDKVRREIKGRQEAIVFWQKLASEIESGRSGTQVALATIEEKVTEHLATIAAKSKLLETAAE